MLSTSKRKDKLNVCFFLQQDVFCGTFPSAMPITVSSHSASSVTALRASQLARTSARGAKRLEIIGRNTDDQNRQDERFWNRGKPDLAV